MDYHHLTEHYNSFCPSGTESLAQIPHAWLQSSHWAWLMKEGGPMRGQLWLPGWLSFKGGFALSCRQVSVTSTASHLSCSIKLLRSEMNPNQTRRKSIISATKHFLLVQKVSLNIPCYHLKATIFLQHLTASLYSSFSL